MEQWMAGKGRVENLKSFKPGQSGNPGGRPKKTPYTNAHRLIAEMIGVADLHILPTDTVAECVAKIMAREALKGAVRRKKSPTAQKARRGKRSKSAGNTARSLGRSPSQRHRPH